MEDYTYIKESLKLLKLLIVKVKQLKQELKASNEIATSEETYYAKYNKLSLENLELKERVAKLELEVASTNHELEKRNKTISQLSTSNLKGMSL